VFITVDEPKSEGFGPTKHTTYRCSSRGSSGATASVRHRFSNFVQLRDTLLELLPGVVVPPLPEKQVMNRFAAEFVEKRRDMLETFLQQIVDHPLAATNEKVHTFLEWTESLRKPVLERCSGFQLPSLPPLEAGDPLKDAGKMLDEFAKQLQSIRETFKRLQARQNEDGLDLHELSQGIKLLSNNPMNSVRARRPQPPHCAPPALSTPPAQWPRRRGWQSATRLHCLSQHVVRCLGVVGRAGARDRSEPVLGGAAVARQAHESPGGRHQGMAPRLTLRHALPLHPCTLLAPWLTQRHPLPLPQLHVRSLFSPIDRSIVCGGAGGAARQAQAAPHARTRDHRAVQGAREGERPMPHAVHRSPCRQSPLTVWVQCDMIYWPWVQYRGAILTVWVHCDVID
jgi:hypothetical protein